MSTPNPSTTEWVPLASSGGPPGPSGAIGPQGPQGIQGPAGAFPTVYRVGGAVSGFPTDMAWTSGGAAAVYHESFPGGGQLRSYGIPPNGAGTILRLRANSGYTLLHVSAGNPAGSARLYLQSAANLFLAAGGTITLIYDASNNFWVEAELSNPNAEYLTYTPALGASTTAPTIGTSPTVQARYGQQGKMVHCYGRIVTGTGFVGGVGNYDIALPVAASPFGYLGSTFWFIGMGELYDVSAFKSTQIFWAIDTVYSRSKMRAYYISAFLNGSYSLASPTSPFTWADGDTFRWNCNYEAA